MLVSTINNLIRRWFPKRPGPETRRDTDAFYACREDYHRMTASAQKSADPQVAILESLLKSGGEYFELGCGCGDVCRLVGRAGRVTGVDVSPLAIKTAMERNAMPGITYLQSDATAIPLKDAAFDGAYSFEVLEHLWDPVAALKEMVRVVKPGGFILLSMPNGFSLDLHLRKKRLAQLAECTLALVRLLCDRISGKAFLNIIPNIKGSVYPDCDMVSAIIPRNLARELERMGCSVEFWDTTYMCAHREGSGTDLRYQKLCAQPFFKHFGDHVLMLARKSEHQTEIRGRRSEE